MVWQPTQLTRAQREERRLAAARLLRAGRLSQAEIAREVGVHRASVTRWKRRLACGGVRALRRRRGARPPPPPPPPAGRGVLHRPWGGGGGAGGVRGGR